jgi:hypothetical protein
MTNDRSWLNLGKAIAAPDRQPQTAFDALNAAADQVIGVKLFTLMTFDQETREARRIHSNMPDAYPVQGTKPMNESGWADIVFGQRKSFVANDIEAIAEVFPDHELIRSLGCESVINIPIVVAGNILGTINCLHVAGHYTDERTSASEVLKLPGAACFLLNAALSAQGEN